MINTDNYTPWTASGELTHPPVVDRDIARLDLDPAIRGLGAAIGRVEPCRAHANDNYPRLVALTGMAGSGKSTASSYLVERHGYTLVKFAGPLKAMIRALGLDDRQIEGDLKEVASDLLNGHTPRHAMQTLGTQWGRDCLGDDFWINLWKQSAVQHKRVVVDDCRFPNEAQAVRKLGGMIIRLDGRGGIAGTHASEAGCGVADATIKNDGCIVDLYTDIEQEVRRWAA